MKIRQSLPLKQIENKQAPGPGAYNPRENISNSGHYFNSKYCGSRCRRFGQAKKLQGVEK